MYVYDPDDESLEDALGVCCGQTTNTIDHLHKSMQLIARRSAADTTALSAEVGKSLAEHLGGDLYAPMASIYLHYLERLDLAEHGAGIAGCWLTQKGKVILAELDKLNPGSTCGKEGCSEPSIGQAWGSLCYEGCEEHLPVIRTMVDKER